MIDELVRTSPGRLLITLDSPEFDNYGAGDNPMRILVAFPPSGETWVGLDIRTDTGAKACHFNGSLTHNMGK